MKQLILIFSLMVFTFAPVLNVHAENDTTYQKKESTVKTPKIGFYVYVQKCGEVSELKTQSLPDAEKFIQSFYPDFCADLEYIIERSPYYRENCFEREIYCEKMRITKKGKYKRLKIKTKNLYL